MGSASNKSYVTVEQHICPVCGVEHDSGAILMDRRMRDRFEHTTLTGYSLCDVHQKQNDEGYVFLIGAIPKGVHSDRKSNFKEDDVTRTGELVSIKRHVAEQLFNCEVAPMMYVEPAAVKKIQEICTAHGIDPNLEGDDGNET